MKIKITKSVLLDSLKKVQDVTPPKGALLILGNTKMVAKEGKLSLTSTDIDLSIVCDVTCEVIDEGETTLPVRLLSTAIASLAEGTVELSVDANNKATVRAGSSTFRIFGIGVEDFPKLPESDGTCIEIPQNVLKDMIRKTSYAASKDDTRRTLCGNLFSFKDGKFTVVATDGRRLAVEEQVITIPKDVEFVVPAKTVQELSRNLNGEEPCKIVVAGSQVFFDIGTVKIYSKVLADAYPNYRQVIPNDSASTSIITIDRQLMVDSLNRISIFSGENAQVKLTFDAGMCHLNSKTTDSGEAVDSVPIKFNGEKIEAVFNPYFIADALKAIDEDDVEFHITTGTSPIVIRKAGLEDFLYVLMPLRI